MHRMFVMGLPMHWHGVPLHVQLRSRPQIVGVRVCVIYKAHND